MILDEGKERINSCMGSLCSFLIFILICTYGYYKKDILIDRKDVDILSAVLDYYHEEDFTFDYQNGFNVAIAFTDFSDETNWILDDSYGEIVAQVHTWGQYQNGTTYMKRETINSHLCTPEELGIKKGI